MIAAGEVQRDLFEQADGGQGEPSLVISLWQPWAMMWALGEKRNETRHWCYPRAYTNQTIYIHAAKKWSGGLAEYCQMRAFREAFARHLDVVGEDVPEQVGVTYRMVRLTPGCYIKLPFGCLIGKVKLIGDWPTNQALSVLSDDDRAREDAFGDFSHGRRAWLGAEHRVLDRFIPLSGSQGFFTYNGSSI